MRAVVFALIAGISLLSDSGGSGGLFFFALSIDLIVNANKDEYINNQKTTADCNRH